MSGLRARHRARLAVTRWRQRIVRFYLLRWRDNAKFARQLKASWAKLESRITQRHVEDGFGRRQPEYWIHD